MDDKERETLTADLRALFAELQSLGYQDGYAPSSQPVCSKNASEQD